MVVSLVVGLVSGGKISRLADVDLDRDVYKRQSVDNCVDNHLDAIFHCAQLCGLQVHTCMGLAYY